jgi:hypothetical protein
MVRHDGKLRADDVAVDVCGVVVRRNDILRLVVRMISLHVFGVVVVGSVPSGVLRSHAVPSREFSRSSRGTQKCVLLRCLVHMVVRLQRGPRRSCGQVVSTVPLQC